MDHAKMGDHQGQEGDNAQPCGPNDDGGCEICDHLSVFSAKTEAKAASHLTAFAIQASCDHAVVDEAAKDIRQIAVAPKNHIFATGKPPPINSPVTLKDRLLN